jgi:preprotein translocase subunit SecG
MYINLLVVAHIILAFLLILVVLLQRSESNMGALGGSNAVFTGKSVSGILSKATTILVVLFMVTSLLLVKDSYKTEAKKSVVDIVETKTTPVEQQEPELPSSN